MGRQKVIETQELLRIARETFLEKGIGAPTSEIARRAGVSEAAVFKRFPTKSALFFAALGFPEFDAQAAVREHTRGKDPQRNLAGLLLAFYDHLTRTMPILSMLITHPAFDPQEFKDKFAKAPINTLVAELTGYLQREQRLGRIGDCDPVAVAGLLFSAIHSFAMFEYMGFHQAEVKVNAKLIHQLVDVLWHGIKPAKPHPDQDG
jgi:AcrR family transcriptional regulator